MNVQTYKSILADKQKKQRYMKTFIILLLIALMIYILYNLKHTTEDFDEYLYDDDESILLNNNDEIDIEDNYTKTV